VNAPQGMGNISLHQKTQHKKKQHLNKEKTGSDKKYSIQSGQWFKSGGSNNSKKGISEMSWEMTTGHSAPTLSRFTFK